MMNTQHVTRATGVQWRPSIAESTQQWAVFCWRCVVQWLTGISDSHMPSVVWTVTNTSDQHTNSMETSPQRLPAVSQHNVRFSCACSCLECCNAMISGTSCFFSVWHSKVIATVPLKNNFLAKFPQSQSKKIPPTSSLNYPSLSLPEMHTTKENSSQNFHDIPERIARNSSSTTAQI